MDKNIQFQHFAFTQKERVQKKNQILECQWMTGLSVAGKSTLTNTLEQELNKKKDTQSEHDIGEIKGY